MGRESEFCRPLVPLLFRLSERLDAVRHDLAEAVREFNVRLQDAMGDQHPARIRAALLWLKPLCVCVRSLRTGSPADQAAWDDVKQMAMEADRLVERMFAEAS